MCRKFRPWPAPALSFCLLALGGCAFTTAEPERSLDLGVPPAWSTPSPSVEGDLGLGDPWWEAFGDPRLGELVEEALAENYDLLAAARRLEQAEARARIAGAELVPQVSAGLDASRARRNFIGFPIPGSGDSVLSSTSTTFGVALNVSWEADLWGRLRAGRDAARADGEAARRDLEAARLSLAGQTAKAWFALLEAGEQIRLARRTLENRRSTREKIRRRYEAGLRPALDLRLAASNEAAAQATLAARERQGDAARRQLQTLLGRYPDGALESEGPLPDLQGPLPAGLPADLVVRRPDLQAAERRLAGAGARVAQARAALYPALRLTGSAGRASEELGDLLSGDFSVWSLAAGILQPIFQGGRLRAGVDLASATADEALARYAQAVLLAFAEVEGGLAAEGFLARQEEALGQALRQAAAAQETAERRYGSGLAEYLEVLESQRQAVELESRLLEIRRQRLTLRVDLYLALGGGTIDPEEFP